MEIKTLAAKLIERGFKSNQVDSPEMENAVIELLSWQGFFDKLTLEMELLEERVLDEKRGKPKTRAEWLEYIGEN
jgi:hypothetical protein